MTKRALLSLLLATLALGCQAVSGSIADAAMHLDVSNGTDLTLDLIVNGSKVADLGAGQQVDLAASQLPPLPWAVSANFPNGRALVSLTVRSGDVRSDSTSLRGDGARVDLSCGRIDLWSGPPLLGPAPGAGSPGDCDP